VANDMLTLDEIAEVAKVTKPTLRRWLRMGLMPSPVRLGPRSLRFRRADIDNWLSSGCVQHRVSGVVPFESAWLPDEPMATAADLADLDDTE